MGPSGIIFTRSSMSLAGTATLPPLTTWAGILPESDRYRSVAARRRLSGLSIAKRTLESTGIVLLRSATPCMRVISLRRSFFATVSSIRLLAPTRRRQVSIWISLR